MHSEWNFHAGHPENGSWPDRYRGSSIRRVDVFREVVASLCAQPGRTILTLFGTVLGVAAFVAVTGIVQTATGQISDGFSQLEATTVRVTDQEPKLAGDASLGFPIDTAERLCNLNGVSDATLMWVVDDEAHPLSIATDPYTEASMLPGYSVIAADNHIAGFADHGMTAGSALDAFQVDTGVRAAMLGSQTAKRLGITDLAVPRTIYLGGESFSVIGIMSSSSRIPQLDTSVVIPDTVALGWLGAPTQRNPARAVASTETGAASLIARQAPYALRADAPERALADAPQDWSKATRGVRKSMTGLVAGLAGLSLLIGCVSIAGATMASVTERIPEFGLRRSLGARTTDIAIQIITETAVIGIIGGLLGGNIGLVIIVVVSISQSWTAVVDPLLLLLGPVIGVISGVAAGICPAVRASRISPIGALQHG
ncbi:ABC transporter permease [Bifidobacterium apri]|uniref:ABC transporter permease n=1 Tax=Bifidobacterium apri TaxID=1769423 RepID=UPI0039927C40